MSTIVYKTNKQKLINNMSQRARFKTTQNKQTKKTCVRCHDSLFCKCHLLRLRDLPKATEGISSEQCWNLHRDFLCLTAQQLSSRYFLQTCQAHGFAPGISDVAAPSQPSTCKCPIPILKKKILIIYHFYFSSFSFLQPQF